MTKKNIKWSDKDIQIIKNNHGKKTLNQIKVLLVDKPNCSYTALRSKCQEMGLFRDRLTHKLPNKNTFNLEYWKEPNLINSCFAGRVASDGCIFIDKHNSYVFSYKCATKDECIIDEFIKEFNFAGKKQYTFNESPNSFNISKLVDIKMNSFDINASYLKKHFNIVPQKTHRLGPTNLNDNVLNLVFCIGLIDGDGTIAIKYDKGIDRKDVYIHFCSCSKPIVEWYKDLLDRIFPSKTSRVAQVGQETGENVYRLTICGLRAAIIVDYLRQFPVWKLPRKWNNPEILSKIEEYKQKHAEYFTVLTLDYFEKYLPKIKDSNSQSPLSPVNIPVS